MKNKVAVLHILEATVGGTRKHLVSLVDGLDKTKFAVEVAATPLRQGTVDDTRFLSELSATGVPFHPLAMARSIAPFTDAKALWQLHHLLRQKQYDVIHTHSSKAGFLGRLAARIHGIPVVYTPNGYYFLDANDGKQLKKRFFLELERAAGRWTDYLIAVSESERQITLAHNLVPPQRVGMIPNGIDVTAVTPDPFARVSVRQELGIGMDTAVIGTVARFIPQKDPFTFIRAAQLILEQNPHVCFIWCGEGDMRTATEQMATAAGIHHAFHFLGFRSDITRLMNAFDIFMLTSIFEGLPYTLLEAMALALPLVATQVVGSQDVVVHSQTGYLTPPGNAPELAQAALSLLAEPEKRQIMGQHGRERVVQHFDVRHMIAAVEKVYELVASC